MTTYGIRLHQRLVTAGIPIESVRIDSEPSRLASVIFKASATAADRSAAATLVASFDWSVAAENAYIKSINGVAAKDVAASVLDTQAIAYRALLIVIVNQLNALRVQVGLAQITKVQLIAAVNTEIDILTA